jgi:hypothetical protein
MLKRRQFIAKGAYFTAPRARYSRALILHVFRHTPYSCFRCVSVRGRCPKTKAVVLRRRPGVVMTQAPGSCHQRAQPEGCAPSAQTQWHNRVTVHIRKEEPEPRRVRMSSSLPRHATDRNFDQIERMPDTTTPPVNVNVVDTSATRTAAWRICRLRAARSRAQLEGLRGLRELTRLQQRLPRVDVLIELGLVLFDRAGGELLFNLITDRYERRATIVTTNLAFAEWVAVFVHRLRARASSHEIPMPGEGNPGRLACLLLPVSLSLKGRLRMPINDKVRAATRVSGRARIRAKRTNVSADPRKTRRDLLAGG